MPVDPKIFGLAMKAVDKVMDSSYGDKALDKLVSKPSVEKKRKKRRSGDIKRPSGPRRRSERQARRTGGVKDDRMIVEEESPHNRGSQETVDLNGPSNISGFTFSTCGTSVKTNKYQLVPEND